MGGGNGGGLGGIVKTVMNPVSALWSGDTGQGGGGAQMDIGPMPTAPTYNFGLADNGLLQDQFNNQYGSAITPDTTAMNAIQGNALSTAPSSWAQAQSAAAKLQNQGLQDQAQQQNASANAQAQNSLASKYGLSHGAQERLATQSQRDNMNSLQNVGFQGAQAQAGIAAQDAANKQNQLMAVPGMQNANAGALLANRQAQLGQENFNTSNALRQNELQNASKLNTYNQQMANYGANKNANAMQAQSAGGKK